MTTSSVKLDIPGYQVFEQRREKGKRGGIAMIVKKGIKVLRYIGNEYTQGVCLQGQGGEKIWVGNVYLPPAPNLAKRRIDEQVARSFVEDILGCIPPQET